MNQIIDLIETIAEEPNPSEKFKKEIDRLTLQVIDETKKLYNTLRSYLNINQFKV